MTRTLRGGRVRSAVSLVAAWIAICAVLVTLFPLAVAPAGAPVDSGLDKCPELATLDVCNIHGTALSTNGHCPGLCVPGQNVFRPQPCRCRLEQPLVLLPEAPLFPLEYPPRA